MGGFEIDTKPGYQTGMPSRQVLLPVAACISLLRVLMPLTKRGEPDSC
jgi:hypothetical protein